MASAADFTFSAVTCGPKQFQLFQPRAGVSPIVSPTTIFMSLSVLPSAFFACSITLYSPRVGVCPEMNPVAGSMLSPVGSPSAENCNGRNDVAATENRNGCPGRTPKSFVLLIRGVSGDLGVRIVYSSFGRTG